MVDVNDLKIQVRAAKYNMYYRWFVPPDDARVLEFRILEDQDREYMVRRTGWFWDLLRKMGINVKDKKVVWKNLDWIRPRVMTEFPTEYYPPNDVVNIIPIFCNTEKKLEEYKKMLKTYGDFLAFKEKRWESGYEKWKNLREKYIDKYSWY